MHAIAVGVGVLVATIVGGGCRSVVAPAGFVVVVDGRVVHRGAAAYTVRAGAAVPERVVAVDGVGEVIVGDAHCRFVRADAGLAALQIVEHEGACAELKGDRLCFARARFGENVVVDGCADQNTIFRERTAGDAAATLGPRTLIEHCVPLPGEAQRYVRVDDIHVDGVDDARRGLRFGWNGDGFDVCFLTPRAGAAYEIAVTVDDHRETLRGTADDG